MQSQSDLEQSLTRLKPAADRTILKDLTMSRQLEDRILAEVQSETRTAEKPIQYKRYLWTIVAFAIATATTFTAFGLLHSSKTTAQSIAAIEVSMIAATPAGALSTLLTKDNFRIGDYRLRGLPTPYNVT